MSPPTGGAPSGQPSSAPSDPAAPETRATSTELTARFQRDVIPLLYALHRRALSMTQRPADAEDLLQETMLRAFVSFGSFRDGTNLNAWLHRILTNTFIDGYRKKQRQPKEYPTEKITDQLLAANAEHTSRGMRSAEDEVLDMLPYTSITAALQALPEHFRVAVYYADVEGFKYNEIAQLMDTPKGTVMSRLYRGRRQLRDLLAEHRSPSADPSR